MRPLAKKSALSLFRGKGQRPGLEELVELSIRLHRFIYEAEGEYARRCAVVEWVPEKVPELAPVLSDGGAGAQGLYTQLRWGADWAASGFPRVDLRPKRSSAFGATRISKEASSHVVMPWKAFLITLPPGIFTAFSPYSEKEVSVLQVQVVQYEAIPEDRHNLVPGEPLFSFVAQASDGLLLTRTGLSCADWGDSTATEKGAFGLDVEDRDERLLQVLTRIVLGTAVMMTSPKAQELAHSRTGSKSQKQRFCWEPPEIKSYVLGEDVRFDAVRGVGDYIAGNGSSPAVQSLVGWHWRRTWKGRGEDRRQEWGVVKEYWRGPKDAPVKIRAHTEGSSPAP